MFGQHLGSELGVHESTTVLEIESLSGQCLGSELGTPLVSCKDFFSSTKKGVKDDAWFQISSRLIFHRTIFLSRLMVKAEMAGIYPKIFYEQHLNH